VGRSRIEDGIVGIAVEFGVVVVNSWSSTGVDCVMVDRMVRHLNRGVGAEC